MLPTDVEERGEVTFKAGGARVSGNRHGHRQLPSVCANGVVEKSVANQITTPPATLRLPADTDFSHAAYDSTHC